MPATTTWRRLVPPWPVWLWLALCGALVLLPAQEALRYDRAAVNRGEWWRLLTANAVHANAFHYALNAAGVLVQCVLFRGLLPTRTWLAVAAWCGLANVAGLHAFAPQWSTYVGMSGALYGTATIGALALLARREWLVGGVLTVYLIGRIAGEQIAGPPAELARWIAMPVAIDAHLWGLASGIVAALAIAAGARARRAR